MNYFDNDTISYTAQGELRRNNSSTESDNISCHGKYVSLVESDSPWYTEKINQFLTKKPEIIKENMSDLSNNNLNNNIVPDKDSKLINFNTIVSSLFILILLLFAIRHYIKN